MKTSVLVLRARGPVVPDRRFNGEIALATEYVRETVASLIFPVTKLQQEFYDEGGDPAELVFDAYLDTTANREWFLRDRRPKHGPSRVIRFPVETRERYDYE